MQSSPRAVYIHVPFCRHRCGYCNFTVVAGREDLHEPLLDALEIEFSRLGEPKPVDTLYIGGGTPTLLNPRRLERLCRMTRHWFPPNAGYEWSIEANPSDLDPDRLDVLVENGVTRLSLGAQSLCPAKLRTLERDHQPDDVRRVFQWARPRFSSVSLDLMFAAPGESFPHWKADLRAAIELDPDHISTYELTYDKGARFFGRLRRGELATVDEETQLAMYEWTIDTLTRGGWEHYEVSNFAKPGHRCRHNVVYWTGASWYAAGPGATRYIDGQYAVNHRSTTTYLKRVLAGQSPVTEIETLTRQQQARERLVFQLRMLDGISRTRFAAETGFDIDQLAGPELRKFVSRGLLEDTGTRIRLTRSGLMVSDGMWPELL